MNLEESAPGDRESLPARRVAWLPAVAVPLALVLVTTSLYLVDASRPEAAGGNAAAFVPTDGESARFRAADGAVNVVEHARMIGIEGVLTTPSPVASALLASLGETGTRTAQLWRETSTDESGAQFNDLYVMDERGVSEVAAWGGGIGFIFDPALTLLPADVRAGSEWSGEGFALPGGVLTYRASYQASAAPELATTADGTGVVVGADCLQVEGTLVLDQPGVGQLAHSTDTTIWCAGEGRIYSSGTLDDVPVESVRLAPDDALPSAMRAGQAPVADQNPASGTPAGTVFDTVYSDPFFGETPKTGSVPLAPSVTTSGLLVVANSQGDDVQAWRLAGSTASLEWAGHPGGVIVALSTVGDLTLVATSERRVHAYDALGRRLWTWRGSELALARVEAAGGGTASTPGDVIIVTRDGRVTRVGGSDGSEVWRMELGADARSSYTVTGGIAVIADERGRVNGIEMSTGNVAWRTEPGLVQLLSSTGDAPGTVFAVTFDGELVALDAHDGATLWSQKLKSSVGAITAAGDVAVVAGAEETVAFDRADGAKQWSSPGAEEVVSSGGAKPGILSLHGETVSLRSLDGAVTDEWSLPVQQLVSENHLLAPGGQVMVVDSYLVVWQAAQR